MTIAPISTIASSHRINLQAITTSRDLPQQSLHPPHLKLIPPSHNRRPHIIPLNNIILSHRPTLIKHHRLPPSSAQLLLLETLLVLAQTRRPCRGIGVYIPHFIVAVGVEVGEELDVGCVGGVVHEEGAELATATAGVGVEGVDVAGEGGDGGLVVDEAVGEEAAGAACGILLGNVLFFGSKDQYIRVGDGSVMAARKDCEGFDLERVFGILRDGADLLLRFLVDLGQAEGVL